MDLFLHVIRRLFPELRFYKTEQLANKIAHYQIAFERNRFFFRLPLRACQMQALSERQLNPVEKPVHP